MLYHYRDNNNVERHWQFHHHLTGGKIQKHERVDLDYLNNDVSCT